MATLPKALGAVRATLGYPLAAGLLALVLLSLGTARVYGRWHHRHEIAARLARLRI